MSEFLSYLTSHLIESELLISLTLKTSLILAIAGLANVLLHQSSAALRHWLWSIAFLGILLFPLATALLPTWQVRILPDSLFPEETVISQAAQDPLEAPVGAKTPPKGFPYVPRYVNNSVDIQLITE